MVLYPMIWAILSTFFLNKESEQRYPCSGGSTGLPSRGPSSPRTDQLWGSSSVPVPWSAAIIIGMILGGRYMGYLWLCYNYGVSINGGTPRKKLDKIDVKWGVPIFGNLMQSIHES